jgi:hypothetical protein
MIWKLLILRSLPFKFTFFGGEVGLKRFLHAGGIYKPLDKLIAATLH